MADVAELVHRIRSFGANVAIDSGRLRIVNGGKLPSGALDFIKANGAAVFDHLEREAEFDERAAIIEFDGKTPRQVAEDFAKLCIKHMTNGWSELDRSWAIGRCAAIIDEVGEQQARAA